MNYRVNYRVEDLLKDNEFICYALNIPSEAASQWENLLKEYSALAKEAEIAKAILLGEDETYMLPTEENEELKKRLFQTLEIA
ncbi:hypothetical protein [Bacteroides sp. 224]|uniref:hypothetical protein n=1 Tax=Bacteroides sp. 224 TaxID=2302936 RepID=UPI0013CFF81D|nr:hypothetical protein [Bacteroides sp. 224]NDV64032.1 hypothetical protein [Bacteroides sp. 224]